MKSNDEVRTALPPPFSEWLRNVRVIPPSGNGVALLIVEEKALPIARSLEIGRLLFGYVRNLHPETTAVLPVTGSVYQHVDDDTLQVANVQLPRSGRAV